MYNETRGLVNKAVTLKGTSDMGLDGVELLLATEEEFQIAISDEEAVKCETPGMLTDLVYSKLRKSQNELCPSMHGFYVVRKKMMDYFSLPREMIRPDSRLDELISKKNRINTWKDFLRTLSDSKTMYAPLSRPKWVKALIVATSLSVFVITYFKTDNGLLPFVALIITGFIIQVATSNLKVEFPGNFSLVKDLTRIVSTLDATVWQKEDVYNRVKEIVIEQLGVKESDVHPNSHFIDDLGMG
jgi:acyl carrier protein